MTLPACTRKLAQHRLLVAAELVTYYRVMCGRKAHSRWLESQQLAWNAAVKKGLASFDRSGRFYPGPLVWIEIGRRDRPKARTVPMHDGLAGRPLPLLNRPTLPMDAS